MFDKVQLNQMKSHQLLLVDTNDKFYNTDSKWDAHHISTASLHRAFSLFLFDAPHEKLLLQKRATEKITFPNLWTNTCCSHPRNEPEEISGIEGCKIAASRRVNYEMNIEFLPENITFLTKILYEAQNYPNKNFCEKELDYILTGNLPTNFELPEPHPNEVSETAFLTWEEISNLDPASLTPWFKMILKNGILQKMFERRNFEANTIHNFEYTNKKFSA